MRTDPKPDEGAGFFDAQCTPTETYAHRVDVETVVDFLELEGGMLGGLRP